MFNLIGLNEIIVILIITLIFIGPKQIPSLAKNLGKLISKIKNFSYSVQNNFTNYLNDYDSIEGFKNSTQNLKQEVKKHLQEIKNDINNNIPNENNILKNEKFSEAYINQKIFNTLNKKSLYIRSLQQRKNLTIKNVNFKKRIIK